MRILVTGAAGLYGIHLVDRLVKRDDVSKVFGVDNFSRNFLMKDPFEQIKSPEFEKKFEFIRKDYRDLDIRTINLMELDAVIHLAAFVAIEESMDVPDCYFKNNEEGTFNLCQILLKSRKQPKLIYASSPEVYGNPKYVPMDEDHPLNPVSIYAVTKLACEKHCMAVHNWHGYPTNIIRNFNTFGGNENIWAYTAVIPKFIRNSLLGEPLPIEGKGDQTRDFLYVKDAIEAYSLLLEKKHWNIHGEIFNIGTGKQTSILELAETIKELANSKSEIISIKPRPADLIALHADVTKSKKVLNWEPKFTLKEGLAQTVNWYKKYLKLK